MCERLVGTCCRELFDRVLVYSEAHLQKILAGYSRHYNGHRPHLARYQLPPDVASPPTPVADLAEHRIRRRQLLGGLIN